MFPWGVIFLVIFILFLISKLIALINTLNNLQSEKNDIQASSDEIKVVKRLQTDRLKNIDDAISHYNKQWEKNNEDIIKELEESKDKIKNMDSEEYVDYISEEIKTYRKKLISHLSFISLPIILSLIWFFMRD